MQKIIRSAGTTPSEKYLAKLADRTFLNLWSYPNFFNDRKEGEKGTGKELCDLLVICGDDVLVFSDKSIQWPTNRDLHLAWSRWYRRAIANSVKQIRGAERWLLQFPDRIFIDPACLRRLPIELPVPETRRVHGIIVALGAHEACGNYFGGDVGTFPIKPVLKGDHHITTIADGYMPFAIGDVAPNGSFIHVFDNYALDLVMNELDTISDLTRYLVCRERIIRSEQLLWAAGEDDLLGLYLQLMGEDGDHDFVKPDGSVIAEHDRFVVPDGMYERLINRPEYLNKKRADEVSYVWDRLIEKFGTHVLEGTSVTTIGDAPNIADVEAGLRAMALENRVLRRMLGGAVISAMETALERRVNRFCRVIIPGTNPPGRNIIYVFLIFAYQDHFDQEDGYDTYRRERATTLWAYCLNVLSDNRNLTKVIGIAIDASPEITGRRGGSEDILMMEVPNWTDTLGQQAERMREAFGIFDPHGVEQSAISGQEYPQSNEANPEEKLSRQQRRARERARRKASRRHGK